ncbi:hypothetical protein [Paraurantiacibacter namhicola]|uniref:Phosphopantetheine adenylyltransferase n=1 Tax=Paraurantiacibacter namhicola TaxID=645517 RepID=A0A1C7DAD6_9SPHN|nr:hypothetical protein [Paraurantiacibacter namhicola]ANU08332.1 hypothetical protein A6F65_02045 [Paraurantiacibacter namhicola]
MIAKLLWAVLALIHAMPAAAFFRPQLLTTLYGLPAGDPLFLLMQHRAALFAVIVIACLWALWDPQVRRLASVLTAISMLAFLALYFSNGSPPTLRTIALVDLAGLPVLAAAAWMAWRS